VGRSLYDLTTSHGHIARHGRVEPQCRSQAGGDNLYLASIVALAVDTGILWHYQGNRRDNWATVTQPMILADLTNRRESAR